MEDQTRFIFHQGFDEPMRIAGFTLAEVGSSLSLGFIVVLCFKGFWSLLGLIVFITCLVMIKKTAHKHKARGTTLHLRWRFGFWKGKHALPRFPESNKTRFDN